MSKSEIRKKILKIRKQNNFKKLKINSQTIFKVLKKENIKGKILGGYYPYNYEIDGMQILKEFEKKKLYYFTSKIKKKFTNGFFLLVNKRSIDDK